MKLAVVCNQCNTIHEFSNGDFHSEFNLSDLSNTNFIGEFDADIDGFDEDVETESDLDVVNNKVIFRCKSCNSSITISQ